METKEYIIEITLSRSISNYIKITKKNYFLVQWQIDIN